VKDLLTLLARLFIKDYKSLHLSKVRGSYGILCGMVGIFLNLLLFAGKLFVGFISGSIAATADAFNNLSDAGSSIITAVGFRLAGQKPDLQHPFGHGRIEYVSGAIVSMLIMVVGVELFKSSIEKIINPTEVELSTVAIIIMCASVCIKLYMAFYNNRIGKKIDSVAMKAVARDSISDCCSTSAVLLSLIVTDLTSIKTDGWFGLLVALFVMYTGYKSMKDTISPLLGQQPDKELVEKIEKTVLSYPEIIGLHDLIVHDYGPGRQMISLHAEVSRESDITAIHEVIDNAEKELFCKTGCQAVIHMDPVSSNDGRALELKNIISELVKKIDERVTVHDFRIVEGRSHTNVIFDVVVPYEVKKSESELKKEVYQLVNGYDNTLYAVVEIDRAYA
jgi:cation diffusion facilitator family transporter